MWVVDKGKINELESDIQIYNFFKHFFKLNKNFAEKLSYTIFSWKQI